MQAGGGARSCLRLPNPPRRRKGCPCGAGQSRDYDNMTGTLLSFGHGYTARALGRRLAPAGWTVLGTTRDAATGQDLASEGAEPVLLGPDGLAGADLSAALARADHVLVSIAPDATGDPVLAAQTPALRAAAPHLRWIGYLSTTAVYGDHAGGWVDETTPTDPASSRGRARVLAEGQWLDFGRGTGVPVQIFRLAGIYGPGRGPFEKLRNGTAQRVIKPGQYFSRAHVEDIATVLAASMARPDPGAVYNVCDDEPAPPQEVLTRAAAMIGVPPPPEVAFEQAEMSPMARAFYADSKRVRNDRIKRDLGVRLAYPTLESGLRAILAAET